MLESLRSAIHCHTSDRYGASALQEAWNEFSLWEDGAPRPIGHKSPHWQLFQPWFMHRWCPDARHTEVADTSLHAIHPTRAYLRQWAGHTDMPDRRYLEACLSTFPSFHQVMKVIDAHTYSTLDLLTGKICGECHRTLPHPNRVHRLDILYGQCVILNEIGQLESCGAVALPAHHRHEVFRRGRLPAPIESLTAAQQRRLDLRLRAIYFDLAGVALGGITLQATPA